MTEQIRKVPYLADKAKNEDVDVKGKNSSFQVRYVSWATGRQKAQEISLTMVVTQ